MIVRDRQQNYLNGDKYGNNLESLHTNNSPMKSAFLGILRGTNLQQTAEMNE
jgi:hypothetical protein